MDYGFQPMDSGFFVTGTWTPDSNRYRDSGILELHSEFPSPGFWIAKAKIFRILESGFPLMGQ